MPSGINETNTDLDLPLDRILYKLVGTMENVPDELSGMKKEIHSIELKNVISERETLEIKSEITEIKNRISKIEDNAVSPSDIEDVYEKFNKLDKENSKKKKNIKEVIWWIARQIGMLIFAGATAYFTMKITKS